MKLQVLGNCKIYWYDLICFVIFGWIMNGILFFLAFRRVKNEGYQNLGLFFYGKSFLQIPLFKVQTFFIRGNSPVNLVRSKHTHTWPILAEFFFLSVSNVRKQQGLKTLKIVFECTLDCYFQGKFNIREHICYVIITNSSTTYVCTLFADTCC